MSQTGKSYEVVVIGAGVFGAWCSYYLQQAGKSIALLDAYGPGNSRASSGGESRILRMGYGENEIYTRWAIRSHDLWREFFREAGENLFHRTGVLWLAYEDDPYSSATLATLRNMRVEIVELTRAEMGKRYPQFDFGSVAYGILEPESGMLMARRAVQAVVASVVKSGVDYLTEAVVEPPSGPSGPSHRSERLTSIATRSGLKISAAEYVFACGPWLPKLFPELLRDRIQPTRQEVFFFGAPAGDVRFSVAAMPVWIYFKKEMYGVPDLDQRGVKIAIDRHGPLFDPDSNDRTPTTEGLAEARHYLARRLPAMRGAPVLEARVCQYENTSNGDFLIDRHPAFENVWLVGGGSGHGFKHGPAVGEYVAQRVLQGGTVDARFTLGSKEKIRRRAIF
jgi:sarcosine oxidase